MHRIFFDKRCVTICDPSEPALSDPNSVEFLPNGNGDIRSFISMIEHTDTLSRIYIPTTDVEWSYRHICSQFKEVNAAGGLVSNKRGDFLLIKRNGLWDLPKGHQEEGEDIAVTAIREVQEETGITQLELGELICITDHCYLRNGMWHLKHTWWYNMLFTDPLDLTPQKEEDISLAVWVSRASLPAYIINTYPSIAEVFREAAK